MTTSFVDSSGAPRQQAVHLMPFFVDHDGHHPALVGGFPHKQTDGGDLTAKFRGRELTASRVALPEGAQGRVLALSKAPAAPRPSKSSAAAKKGSWRKLRGRGRSAWSDESDSGEEGAEASVDAAPAAVASLADRLQAALRPDMAWASETSFTTVNQWLWDQEPHGSDHVQQCVTWVGVAGVLAGPVSEAELDEASKLFPGAK